MTGQSGDCSGGQPDSPDYPINRSRNCPMLSLLVVVLGGGYQLAGNVFDEFAAGSGGGAGASGVEHLHAARRHGDGIEPQDVAVADLRLEAEPVGTEEASGGVKGDRGGDGAFEVLAGAGQKPRSDVVGPGGAAQQGVVHRVALEGHGVGDA